MELLKVFWGFLKARKKFWLLPIIIAFILIGVLIIYATSGNIVPYIYGRF